MDPARIAEAGIELASQQDVAACCAALRRWTIELTDASDARVSYRAPAEEYGIGPSSLPDGTHVLTLEPGGQVFGEWTAELAVVGPRSEDWERIAHLLTRQAALGLERVSRMGRLDRHERQQRALVEAGKALSSERTLDGVLQRIVEHAIELTGARYGALGVLDDNRETLAAFVTVGIDPETHAKIGELPKGRGILGVLIDDPRPLRLARLQDDPRSVGFPDHHPPMSSFLGVPIVTSTHVAGRIYLTEKQGAPEFSEEDEQLVETLAGQAAIAIDNAALNEQLQRTAAQLQEASQHKSSFLANMSHELRSPLNTIIGYTRLLLDDARGLDEEQVEDLRIIRDSSEHLLALITELLDLQRIEAGRVTLVLSDEDLGEIVESAIASIRPSVPDAVELSADVTELRNPLVHWDRTRMRQVLLNVLGNAAKFTETGHITLQVSDTPDEVTLRITDSGPGIPGHDQARIFDTFFQSQAALGRTPHPNEGAGLGLAITRLLTELHGGTVELESEVGVGTTLTIVLPRRAEVGA